MNRAERDLTLIKDENRWPANHLCLKRWTSDRTMEFGHMVKGGTTVYGVGPEPILYDTSEDIVADGWLVD